MDFVDLATFDGWIEDALDEIPAELADALENVVVVVEEWPTAAQLDGRRGTLLGLYEGVPLTRRGPLAMSVNQAGAFLRSRPQLTRPNLHIYFNPASYSTTTSTAS